MQLLRSNKILPLLLKILMVLALIFSGIIQKPKEVNANPLALLLIPGFVNSAYVTGALGVLGIGALGAGAANSDWYTDNIDQLQQTLTTSAGQMSADMTANLEKSLQDLLLGKEAVFNFTGDLFNNLVNSFGSNANPIPQHISDVLPLITLNSDGIFELPSNVELAIKRLSNDTLSYIQTEVYFNTVEERGYTRYRIANGQYAELQTGTEMEQQLTAAFYNALGTGNINSMLSLFNNIATTRTFGLHVIGHDIYYPTSEGTLLLDGVRDYLTEQLLSNNNKLGLPVTVNDLVNLRTADGVPLYVDNVGQVVLKDGRPFEGDLANVLASPSIPQVIDHAGTLTPVISNDFGMTNIKTGEIVIPNPNPPTPNLPPKVKPETTKPPTGIQRFLPAAVVIVFILFLKSIVFYAIRLFEYLLTLPLIPVKRIDNYALEWFMNAKILGIYVYDTVLAFATFAFSLTIYKVIRRIW